MEKPRIVAFAGSLRKESFNKKLVQVAAAAAREAGGDVTYLDLRDYPLPIYDGDLEEASGIPENAHALKKLFIEADGLLISAPEYNSSMTAVFKNTVDWVSRPVPGQGALAGFNGKLVTLMSASPGGLGGLRGLVHVRAMLANLGSVVLPGQLSIANANEAFAADSTLKDPKKQAGIENLGATLVQSIARWKSLPNGQ